MTSLLLLFFNRHDTLKSVIESVKLYKPSRVYLASDGARSHIEGEVEQVRQVRDYVLSQIDWDCEVKTLFRDENLGCKKAVHEAVQWFFSQEEKGIVLEDDIVPSLNFFHFCEDALERFKDDKRIGSITGRNELGEWGSHDLFTASRFQCWGWASWSDRILGLNVDFGYDKDIDYSKLYENSMWEERCYLDSVLGLLQTNQVNSWAYAYDLNFKKIKQLQIYPKLNMVKNIGFGEAGTHSSSRLSDKVFFYEGFQPSLNYTNIFDDKSYIKQKLRSEYGGIFQLYFMRHIRYLKWLRKLRRKVRSWL
jgi:hypothetical protein